jgi:hypothetical protein
MSRIDPTQEKTSAFKLLETANYMLERAERLSTAVFTAATLLDGKEDLDSVQIKGLSTLLDATATDYVNEISSHYDHIKEISAMF